jgi:hypothetical protein
VLLVRARVCARVSPLRRRLTVRVEFDLEEFYDNQILDRLWAGQNLKHVDSFMREFLREHFQLLRRRFGEALDLALPRYVEDVSFRNGK